MPLYFSTSCLTQKYDFPEILKIYDDLGISNVELGVYLKKIDGLSHLIEGYNFNYIIHHLFPPPDDPIIINLASVNIEILKKSLEQIKRSIDFCVSHNIHLFSFHAGFRGDPDNNFRFNFNNLPKYDKSYDIFRDSILEILNYAEKRNIKIAIENNVLADYNLINSKNNVLLMCKLCEFENLFEEINSNFIGLLLDLGHLKVTAQSLNFNAEEFIIQLKEKIVAIHLHENNSLVDNHEKFEKSDWIIEVSDKYFKNSKIPFVVESIFKNEMELEHLLRVFRNKFL